MSLLPSDTCCIQFVYCLQSSSLFDTKFCANASKPSSFQFFLRPTICSFFFYPLFFCLSSFGVIVRLFLRKNSNKAAGSSSSSSRGKKDHLFSLPLPTAFGPTARGPCRTRESCNQGCRGLYTNQFQSLVYNARIWAGKTHLFQYESKNNKTNRPELVFSQMTALRPNQKQCWMILTR